MTIYLNKTCDTLLKINKFLNTKKKQIKSDFALNRKINRFSKTYLNIIIKKLRILNLLNNLFNRFDYLRVQILFMYVVFNDFFNTIKRRKSKLGKV